MPAPTRKTASFPKSTALQTFDSLNYYDATLTAASASLSAHTTILAGNPTLTGDTLTANGTKATLIGGAGNDSLISRSTSTLLLAGSGRETLVGSASGSSTLIGGSGISLLLSSGAKNSLLGGSGNSTLASTGATNTLVAGTGNATLISSGSNNSLLGNSGNSSLYASGAANTLVAGTGNATLVAGTLSDTLLSSAAKGSTKLVVLSSPGLAVGQTISGSGIPAGAVISSIARQTVAGHGDTLTLSSKLTNSIAGGASLSAYGTHDLLLGGSGNSSLISYAPDTTLVAGSGDATLSAYGTHDLLLGGSGNSSLISYATGNTLKGGLGNVTLVAAGSNDSLLGGYGASSLYASGSGNTLTAGSGAATLLATGASNYLSAGSTSNASQSLNAASSLSTASTLVGSLFPLFTGSNTLVAEGANSSVYGGYGNNLLVALGANDTVSVGISGVSAGSNTLIATGESDLLIGGGGINSLSASGTSDTLIANTLLASTGSSTLVATGAKSSLYGGSGSSSLYASGASSTLVAGPGNATLVAAGTQASLLGGSGANSLYTSADSSTLVAGAGDATLVAAGSRDSLVGGSGANSFLASGLADTLVAGSGNAILVATGTQDYLVGGSGTSSLVASGLSDTLVAGSGSSTLVALGSNSETLLGAPTSSFATLIGNGHSSLVGQGGKNLYVLTTPGDTISETVNGAALQISGNYSASQSTFLLQTLVPGAYVTASLTGNSLTAQAHTSSLSPRVGDTLTAIGNYNTLRGGAGPDSLIAQGVFDYLLAGGGSDTLIGSSIAGASETLAGNGQASLVGRGANDLFLLSLSGDTISAPFSGLRISASANLNLQNQAPGNYFVASLTGDGTSGTAHTTTLGTLAGASGSLSGDTLFTAANAVILTGGAGNDSLIAAGTNDSLFAGAGRDTLLAKGSGSHTLFGSTSSLVSDTLIGNGHSSLVGRGAKDLFILTTPGDTLHASISGDSIQASYGIQLDTLDATHYYTASLTGDYLSASAHRLSIPTLAGTQTLTGDTLFATGNKVTLLGGAGNDSLVALGNGAYLSGGDGKNTLIAASLLGSSSTLVGDGHSSLVAYQGTNAYFQLGLGNDTIAMNSVAGSTAGIVTITTPDSSFYLTGDANYGSGAHGSGVTLANNLISTGISGVTFVGGTKSGFLIGNTTNANSLVAGSSGSQTLIGGASSDTLVGNGSSSLYGGTGNDLYILNTPGDKIGEIAGSGNDTIQSSLASFNLSNTGTYGQGILNVESFVSTSTLSGTGTVYTLTGNGLSNTIVGASLAPNFLQTGTGADSMVGGALNDTLVGNGFSTLVGAAGKNLYYVPSQRSYQTSGDGTYYFTGGYTDTVIDTGSGGGIIGQNTGSAPFYYNLSQLTQAPGLASLSYNGSSAATLIGNANIIGDTIVGGLGPNSLVGGSAGASSLVGNGGSDTLNDGGATSPGAKSTMVGGLGYDFYIVSNAGDVITEAFSSSGGIDSVLTTLTAYNLSDTFVAGGNGVENLVYTGSGGNVTFRGNQLNNILDARNATTSTLIGAAGYDTLLGSSSGTNLFQVLNATDLGSKTSILGGLGTDTLQLLTGGTLGDGAFGTNLSQYVTGVEVLQLSSSSVATLGAAAQFAGISTIVAGTGPDTIDISAYTASATIDAHFDTITSAGQGDSLRGSTSAGTTFLFGSNPNLLGVLAATTLVGQSGQDSLVLNAPVSGLLSVAAGSSGIGLLQLTSKSSLTLGTSAQSLGISTIVAGTGGDTLNASTYTTPVTFDATYFDGASTLGDTLTGSSSQPSTFLFTGVNAGAALTLSSLTGGSGQDSVIVTSATTLGDTAFAAFHSINALVVGGNSAVTLGDNARANGISTLSGLLGNDTFIQTADDTLATTLIGGSGSALFSIAKGSQVAADSIAGGFGLDTLQLTSASTLNDASLSHLSSVEVLQLTGSSAATLGTLAGHGDLSTVIAGTGSSTVDAASYISSLTIDATSDTTNADLLIGSSLGDLFILSNAGPLTIGGASSTITGGTGADTLLFGSGVTLNDALGSNVTGIDVLGLTSSSAVTLGTASSRSGISTIVSGSGGDTIDASSYGASLTLDATSALAAETLIGPSGHAGSFLFSDTAALASSSIQGGSVGNDSLILSSPMTLNDSDGINHPFGVTHGIEVLCLTDPSAVTLGSYAQINGYRTVQGGSGNDSITVTIDETNPLTLLGGAGADFFSIQGIGSNSIVGGSGINTLQLINAGYNISDADLSRLKNIQLLELTSPVGIDLGAGAAGAGISSVFGGTGGDSFSIETSDTVPLYLEAYGTGNSFALANSTLLARETIVGGSNSDTLSILSDASLADSLFTNASQIGYLGLSGSSSVTLGDNAFATGILTVDGGRGSASVDASTYAGTALTLMSGSSGANLLKAGNGATTFFDNAGGGDTLAGGSGNDVFNVSGGSDSIITGTGSNLVIFSDNQLDGTLLTGSGFTTASLASATAVADSGFKSITGLQSIVLTKSHTSITMGSLASGAGVSSILGGATASLVLNATGLTSPLTVLAGSGGFNSISGGTGGINFTGSSTGSDTFSGGSGNDTISLLDETVTGDFLNGGAGNNLFTIYSAGILANNIMDGGLGGTNSLSFGIHDVTLQDNDFLYATHFQNLLLSGQGNSVTLDTNAVNMGIYSITATGGATTVEGSTFSKSLSVSLGGGSNQINLNANSNQLVIAGGSNQATFGGGNNHISISGSANTLFLAGNNDFLSITGGSNHVTLGGGSDSIYAGSGTEFSVASEQVLKGYYTLSGGGNSTLTLTSDGQTLGGSDFIHVSGINALRFSNGNNAIVAGSQGATAGISTVYGGSGTDLLNLAANSTDTRLQGFANLADISVDTLTGGTGSNTFVLGTNLGDAYVSGRGSGQSAQDGYAVITNFDPNSNFLQAHNYGTPLAPKSSLYASGSGSNFNLFYQPSGTGTSDLIATIHETSAFDLSNPAKLASVLHLV